MLILNFYFSFHFFLTLISIAGIFFFFFSCQCYFVRFCLYICMSHYSYNLLLAWLYGFCFLTLSSFRNSCWSVVALCWIFFLCIDQEKSFPSLCSISIFFLLYMFSMHFLFSVHQIAHVVFIIYSCIAIVYIYVNVKFLCNHHIEILDNFFFGLYACYRYIYIYNWNVENEKW